MVSSQLLKFLIAPPNLFALRGAKKQVFDLLRHRDGLLVRQTSGLWMQRFPGPSITSPLTYLNDSRFLGLWHGHSLDMKSLRGVSLWKYQAVYFFLWKANGRSHWVCSNGSQVPPWHPFTSFLFSFTYSRLNVHLDGKDCVLCHFVANNSRQAYLLAHVSWEGEVSYRPWWPPCL